jgi:4-amino-4-deoxy-L-arabinose transferase-like glycosyltransferase
MAVSRTAETTVGAIGGLATGYVLWLVAFSIADDNATAGQWAPIVLALSAALGIGALMWGLLQRRRRNYLRGSFALCLPVLPLVLSLAVLADIYF